MRVGLPREKDDPLPTTPTICVGTDLSTGSAVAVAQAARIAAARGAQLQAVHVLDDSRVAALEHHFGPARAGVRQRLMHEAQAAWSRGGQGAAAPTAQPLHVEIAGRAQGLIRAASNASAELLVLGAGDGERDTGVGTVAIGCVRGAPCDVLIVRDPQAGPFRRIMVGVDFSPASALAVRRAAQLAATEHAELHILHVYSGPASLFPFLTSILTEWAEALADLEARCQARLRDFCDQIASEGGPEEPVLRAARLHAVESNLHGRTIAQTAHKLGADLVVVGTRGHGNVRDALLGTTAERVLRDTRGSILAVKTPAT